MPEITWKKVWRFFIAMMLSIAALALISDVFYFAITTFVMDSVRNIHIDLPASNTQQSVMERALSSQMDKAWKESGGLEKRSIVVDLGENTANIDFSFVIKKDNPVVIAFMGGAVDTVPDFFVENVFGQFMVDGTKLDTEDFQSPSIQVDTQQGLIEVHIFATKKISARTVVTLIRSYDSKIPPAALDEIIVNFAGRKLTAVYPFPAEASTKMVRLVSTSEPLAGLVVNTSLPIQNTGTLSNVLSRQLLLQKVGGALNLPVLGSLLNGILEALPILLFLAIVWSQKESLSPPLLFLSQVFLALLVIHFTFRMVGAIGGLFSAGSQYASSVLYSWSLNHGLPSQMWDIFAVASSVFSISLGYTSVGTALMGIIIPALLLRRSREWDDPAQPIGPTLDPLSPQDRQSGQKTRISIIAILTYLILLAMMGVSAFVFYISRGTLLPRELSPEVALFGVGLCGVFLILLSRYIYKKLDGKPIPPVVGPLVFWVIFIGNLIWSFTFGMGISNQSDVSIQSGWGWLVYATCVGAALVYAFIRILYSLARHAGLVPELSPRLHSALIFFAILTAIPMNALYASSIPAASYYEVWNLASQLDDLIKFIFLAGLTWFFYEEGKQSAALRGVTLAVGLIAMATVFYPSTANWLFIPLTFLIGYRLLSKYLQPAEYWKELEPLYAPVFGNRLTFLEQIVHLNTGERGYQNLHKTLSAKLGNDEITYAKFVEEVDARRKELDESNKAAQLSGKPIKDVALTFGPRETAWENGKHGAYWALIFSLPWMAIWLFNFMTGEAARSSYPLWAFFSDLLNLLTSWVGIGFLFGYFYPFLSGKNGLEKGIRLWLVIILPALPLALISNSTLTAWQGFLFWVLQVFIHCMLLGLIAFDYMTLRQGYRDWQMLFELHGMPSVGVSVSTILIAAGTAITTLLQSGTQEIIKTALTFILPNADKLINILPK